MKTRIGFISNSSSSSFILYVKKEDFDKHVSTNRDDIRYQELKVFGLDLVRVQCDTEDNHTEQWEKLQECEHIFFDESY